MSEFQIRVTTGGSNPTTKQPETPITVRTTGEFERFEDLTRKLLGVPKEELDKQLDKH